VSTATQAARRYVKTHYGELMNADEAQFNEESRTWQAELVSYYPRIINDDAVPENSTVKFLYLRKLGKVELDESLNVLNATPRSAASDLLGDRFSLFRQRAERIMIEASALQIAELTDAKHVLAPIIKIIDNLLDRETKIPEIKDSDFDQRDNVERYWNLLTDTGILMRVEGGWNSGEKFVDIFTKYHNNYDALVSKTLATLIREKYASLRSAFDMGELEPAIHVDNSYYWPALEADVSIKQNTDSLRERHNASYHTFMSVGRFKYYLRQLLQAGAIERESGYWVAVKDLFAEMRKIRGSQLEPSTLRV
jgi:hypothetical protein